MSTFPPRLGCPLCSVVAASTAPPPPTETPFYPANTVIDPSLPKILWKDDNFTAYLEKNNPVSSKGHIIILFNLHVPSVYSLSSSDIGLLSQLRQLAQSLLQPLLPDIAKPDASSQPTFNIGFITSPFKDPKIPVSDHLHVHAYIGDMDLASIWRKLAYASLGGWYALEDLIAEMRETASNNRVKSAYPNRPTAPIDRVPTAGARTGDANGVERTERGILGDT